MNTNSISVIDNLQNKFLYRRQQGSTAYIFYADIHGKLNAEIICGGKKAQSAYIKNLPDEWQVNLNDANKLQKLLQIFEKCYFYVLNQDIYINARGLGGWAKEVHLHRNKEWCQSAGFNKQEAEIIARNCEEVDHGHTDPVKHFNNKEAQGWHFNINKGEDSKSAGDAGDSRIIHAIDCLQKALAKKKDNKAEAALGTLGRGLHSLQDTFSHTDHFVKRKKIKIKNVNIVFYHHLKGRGIDADNPKYIDAGRSPLSNNAADSKEGFSQRYTETREITLFYLNKYRLGANLTCEELASEVSTRLHSLENKVALSKNMFSTFFASNAESTQDDKELDVTKLDKEEDIPEEYIKAIKS
jgi:hypothetical protein